MAEYEALDDSCTRFRSMLESEVGAQFPQRAFPWWELEYLPLLKKLKVKATLIKKDEVFDFWKKYHDEATAILSRIAELEDSLDERVYEIYGLDGEQIGIVEGYFASLDPEG